MGRSNSLVVILAAVLALANGGQSRAQRGDGRENVTVTGEIKGVQAGLLHLVTEKGDQWIVQPPDSAETISYAALAEPSWLQPGLIVRYVGRFTAKGEAATTIRELTVFTPTPGTQMGFVADTNDAAGLFEDPNEPKPGGEEATTYLVAGKIAGVKDGKLVVAWGGATAAAPLDKNVKISVELADLSLIRLGDKVEFQGWFYTVKPGHAKANRMSVTSPEPLAAEVVEEKPKGKGRRGAKKNERRTTKKE